VVAAALVECEAEGVVEWLTAGAVALVAGAELADPDPEAPAPASKHMIKKIKNSQTKIRTYHTRFAGAVELLPALQRYSSR